MGLSSWMFLVVVVLGLAGVVTCEVGDEQMAQVFEAALLELKLSSVFDVSLDDYTTIKDCLALQETINYPNITTDLMNDILYVNNTIRVGRCPNCSHVPPVVLPFSTLANQVALHYQTELTVQYIDFNSTTHVLQALYTRQIEATDTNVNVGGITQNLTLWRPSCSVIGWNVLMASRNSSDIHNVSALRASVRSHIFISEKVYLCTWVESDIETLQYLFFGVDIKLKESANECLQELLFNTAVLAVRITSDVVTLGANVTTFFTQIVSPLSVIFRKEIPEENKINRNDMTEWWETGNGQLLAAYDLAFTNMISSGFYEELFSYFKVPSYFVTDCTLDETKAEYPKTPVGTFFNVLDKRQLKIGVFPVEALPFVKVTPQGEATGILVTLEQQVASWISLRYGSPINISYVVYPNSDAIFDHLDAGDIHCTNLYFSLGGITKANKRRKLEYLSSCAAYGAPLKIVMLSSYSIKSLPGLVDLLKRNTTTTWEVGARPQGTAQLFAEELLTLGIENFHMTVYPSKSAALEAVASGEIIALMPDYPVDLDKNDSAIMSVFEGNVFKISGAFFRQDKVFPCHNGELDKEFGEECDSTQSNCLNCECVGIFQEPSGSLSCEINTPIVVGVTISAAIVLIILIAGIATASVFSMRYLKRKYQQDGAQKLKAGIMFSRRNISQSEMQIPLTNPLVSS